MSTSWQKFVSLPVFVIGLQLVGSLFAVKTTVADNNPVNFDFGPGPTEPGFIKVQATNLYSDEVGWGVDLKTTPLDRDCGGPTHLLRDTLTGNSPFYFSVKLPEGNYRILVTLGDAFVSTTNCIKVESRRLMTPVLITKPGEFVTVAFTVNIRTPILPDGSSVRLKPREKGALHWDEKLTFEFNGSRPSVAALQITPAKDSITVFLLGDSTVTDQPYEPWTGWGQLLPIFFKYYVAVANHAESGESLTSAFNSKRIEKVLTCLKPGDYVLIQFGHNDQKEKGAGKGPELNYRTNLIRLVEAIRGRGAEPILVTPMERKAGVSTPTHNGYPDAMRRVANDYRVSLIDLNKMSVDLYRSLGTNLDLAFVDGSHHTAYGAYELAKCVVRGLSNCNTTLKNHLKEEIQFVPTSPDLPCDVVIPPSPSNIRLTPDGS